MSSSSSNKARYRQIIYTLYSINNSLYGLNNAMTSMKSTMNKTLKVNDKVYGASEIEDMDRTLNSVSFSINHYIIPSLYNKLN